MKNEEKCGNLSIGEAFQIDVCFPLIQKFTASALENVIETKDGIISGVDSNKPRLYHEMHIVVEDRSLKLLDSKRASLLSKHIEGHELSINLKGI